MNFLPKPTPTNGMRDYSLKPTIFKGFWHGPHIGPIRYACLESFLSHGHQFELYTYDYVDVPHGVILRDANTVIPKSEIFYYINPKTGKRDLGPFSDLFRFKLLYEHGGWWSDVDTVCLSSNIPEVDNAWALENPEVSSESVGTSQISLTKGGELARTLYQRCLALSRTNYPQRESLGPKLLSATIRDFSLPTNSHGSPNTFYPIRWIEMFKMWIPEYTDEVEDRSKHALLMPIYQSFPQYIGLSLGRLPPKGSYLAMLCGSTSSSSQRYSSAEIKAALKVFFLDNARWAIDELRAVSGNAIIKELKL